MTFPSTGRLTNGSTYPVHSRQCAAHLSRRPFQSETHTLATTSISSAAVQEKEGRGRLGDQAAVDVISVGSGSRKPRQA
jgi:hypothetical protein